MAWPPSPHDTHSLPAEPLGIKCYLNTEQVLYHAERARSRYTQCSFRMLTLLAHAKGLPNTESMTRTRPFASAGYASELRFIPVV